MRIILLFTLLCTFTLSYANSSCETGDAANAQFCVSVANFPVNAEDPSLGRYVHFHYESEHWYLSNYDDMECIHSDSLIYGPKNTVESALLYPYTPINPNQAKVSFCEDDNESHCQQQSEGVGYTSVVTANYMRLALDFSHLPDDYGWCQ